MKKLMMVVIAVVIALVGIIMYINRDRSEEFKEKYGIVLDEVLSKGTLKDYIKGEIRFIDSKVKKIEYLKSYSFNLEADLKQEFSNLAEERIYELFKELSNSNLNNICGKKVHCSIGTFTFISDNNVYVVDPSGVFGVTKNGERYDPHAPTEEQKKRGEISSSLQFIAEQMYMLRFYGYPLEEIVFRKNNPDKVYSIFGVQESVNKILEISEELGDENSLQSARNMYEKISEYIPYEKEHNNQIVKSFMPDMEAIMAVYSPLSLEEPENDPGKESRTTLDLGHYYRLLK